MTRTRVISGILLLSVLIPSGSAISQSAPFPDMQRSWFVYQDEVEFLRQEGIIEGKPDGKFHPTDAINRAEFLKLVFKGAGANEPVSGDCFPDVKKDSWYAPFVCAAKNRGIINGYPDGTFHQEQTVTFSEALKMLYLSDGKSVEEPSGEHWYLPYMKAFDEPGIFTKHSYIPWDVVDRERAADLIARNLRYKKDRVLPNLSPGCSKARTEVRTTIAVDGVERNFLLTTPADHSSSTPHPLIVAFHGRTNSNDRVRMYYGLDRAAKGYFIAYPAALPTKGGGFTWSGAGDGNSFVHDVYFFDAIVKEIGEHECIDMDRIFTVGHSLGAWMANSVACIRGGIVRGSGTVGGSSVMIDCAGPTAAWIAHNPNDNLASFPETVRALDRRVKENACSTEKHETKPSDLKCMAYEDCQSGNPVNWCPHEQNEDERGKFYPHTWPDGTEQAIVAFFKNLQ